jgi:hypothetical protein
MYDHHGNIYTVLSAFAMDMSIRDGSPNYAVSLCTCILSSNVEPSDILLTSNVEPTDRYFVFNLKC